MKLSKKLKITFTEAKALMTKYFAVFPNIKKKLQEFVDFLIANKYAYSPLDGRRRDFTGVDLS